MICSIAAEREDSFFIVFWKRIIILDKLNAMLCRFSYDLNKKVEQTVCLIVGELNSKLGHMDAAKKFLFTSKTNGGGDQDIVRLAEDRLAEIE